MHKMFLGKMIVQLILLVEAKGRSIINRKAMLKLFLQSCTSIISLLDIICYII